MELKQRSTFALDSRVTVSSHSLESSLLESESSSPSLLGVLSDSDLVLSEECVLSVS